ncbi:MAG: Uma2 family endonuclease [Deltaproteobacteria bacterium]
MSTDAEPMTAEELPKMPRGRAPYEPIRGTLITMSPSGSEHGVVTMRLSSRVDQFVSSRNLGLVFGAETGFRLERNPDTVRAPDLAFVAQVNVPPGGIPRGYWPGPPDLAVEVISQTPHCPSRFFLENDHGEIVDCTTTFEAFISRLWIENEIWFRLAEHDRPLTGEMTEHLRHYRVERSSSAQTSNRRNSFSTAC